MLVINYAYWHDNPHHVTKVRYLHWSATTLRWWPTPQDNAPYHITKLHRNVSCKNVTKSSRHQPGCQIPQSKTDWALAPCLHRSEPNQIKSKSTIGASIDWTSFQGASSHRGSHCHHGVPLSWGGVLDLKRCLGRWCVLSDIQISARPNCLPAEHCIVTGLM